MSKQMPSISAALSVYTRILQWHCIMNIIKELQCRRGVRPACQGRLATNRMKNIYFTYRQPMWKLGGSSSRQAST